ncbi:mechanosensitive ion channel [Brevundimonas sp.]|uniref:mechanosensitive ion channel n=1 Tax=Brevundimonas sp. TaxID=1871086 RepID=UPI0025DA5F0C|nr:mechanosensitive ion channel [Brevundimonas sp.]
MNEPTRYEFIGWEPLLEVWAPRVLGAILILVAAWFIGKAVKHVLAKGLNKLPGADKANEGAEPRHTLGARLGEVGFWLILLFGVVAALGVLNLRGAVEPLNTLLTNIAAFIPSILGAALIFFIGFVVATLAKRLTVAALDAAGLDNWVERAGVTRSTGSTGLTNALGTLVFAVVILFASIAALQTLNITAISEPATAVLTTVLDALPRVLVAALLLALGVFIARWVASVIERVLPATGFDRSISAVTGLTSMGKPPADGASAASTGPGPYPGAVSSAYAAKMTGEGAAHTPMTPSKLVGWVVGVAIVLFFAMEALRLVEFGAAAAIVQSVLELAGRVLVGGIIITAGVLIADVLANLINRTTGGADRFASTLVRWATIALATAMGLSFMGIADEIVVLAFGLILGAAAVAAALAFGLGGREWAGRMLDQWTGKAQKMRGAASTDRAPRGKTSIDPEPRPFNAEPPQDRV